MVGCQAGGLGGFWGCEVQPRAVGFLNPGLLGKCGFPGGRLPPCSHGDLSEAHATIFLCHRHPCTPNFSGQSQAHHASCRAPRVCVCHSLHRGHLSPQGRSGHLPEAEVRARP